MYGGQGWTGVGETVGGWWTAYERLRGGHRARASARLHAYRPCARPMCESLDVEAGGVTGDAAGAVLHAGGTRACAR